MKHFSKLLFLVLALALVIGAVAVFSSAQTGDLAAIGNTEYATLAEAIAAAQDGDTITVLANQTHMTQSAVVSNKAITVDLNGKTINAQSTLFRAGANGKISVVGEGTVATRNCAAIVTEASALGAEIVLGDGVNTVRINDSRSTGNATLINMCAGKLTTNKVEINILKMTAGNALVFEDTEVTMAASSVISYTPGNQMLIRFNGPGKLLKFHATDCVFDQMVLPEDIGTSGAEGGKATTFALPDNEVAAGSSFVLDNCFVGSKWGMFISNGSVNIDPALLTVLCNNCEIFMRNGNFVYNKDHRINRRLAIRFDNCRFNDLYSNMNKSEIVSIGGLATFTGETRVKYNSMALETAADGTVVVPNGYTCYYMRNDKTGYPYLYTAEEVNPSDVILVSTIRTMTFDDLKKPSASTILNTANKAAADGRDQVTDEYIQTPNGTNGFFRWRAMNDISSGCTDAFLDFYAEGQTNGVWTHPFTDYNYVTWDFDIMTDGNMLANLDFGPIGRDTGFHSLMRDGTTLTIMQQLEPSRQTAYLSSVGQNSFRLDMNAWEWHHVTFIVKIVADDYGVPQSIESFCYVDGNRVNQNPQVASNIADVNHINSFRVSYNTARMNQMKDESVCFDNVIIKAYEVFDPEDGYVDVIAPLLADPTLTLAKANYPDYNALYRAPEISPVAKAGDVFFASFEEAYAYTKETGEAITLLRDFTTDIDIDSAIRIYTGGIDWMPSENSWGFVRGEDPEFGEYYEFHEMLNASVEVWWFSNPFNLDPETGYAYIEEVRFGRRIAHPDADTNISALPRTFAMRNDDGTFSLYEFKGWTADPDTGELVTEFPIVDQELLSNEVVCYYAVFAEPENNTAIFVTDEPTSLTLWDYDPENDENFKKDYTIYAFGATIDDFRTFVNNLHRTATVALTNDIIANMGGSFFELPADADLTIDLNGHKLVHLYSSNTRSFRTRGKLTIISSRPGAVIEGRKFTANSSSTGGGGVFEVYSGGELLVQGPNIVVRAAIVFEAYENNYTLTFDNITVEQIAKDSTGLFKIVGTPENIEINLFNCLLLNTISDKTSNQMFCFANVTSATNVVVNIDSCRIMYLTELSSKPNLFRYFPYGTIANISNTIGNYKLAVSDPRGENPKGYNGGDIINGAGNRVGVEYNMSSSGFKQNQFPTGVVRAKTKGTVSFADVFPDGYVSRNPKVVAASYLDYDSGEERVYDQPVEYIQGTFAAEDAPNVIWHETADVSSKKLITERWDKTVADPFYQSAVPAYTAKVGALKIQYAYPNDAWVLFQTDEDGVRHFAPDQERATVSGVSITGLKQNIVLYSDFCMNVFIPVSEMYDLEVSYGDLVLPMTEREIDGALYYAVCVTVGADQAADRITLDLAFTIGGQVFNDTVSTNVAAYAASLAKSEEYADLGYAMLRYAKAAYLYTTEENVAPNALNIADTDAHAEMATAVNTAVENAVVTGVSVNLGEKPVFILFFDETFAGTVTVSYTGVNGESKSVVKEVRVGDGQIGLPEIKLYDLAETLTISVNGEEIRTYNLAAYVGSLAGDDAAIAVAVALYDYVVAAKNYILR